MSKRIMTSLLAFMLVVPLSILLSIKVSAYNVSIYSTTTTSLQPGQSFTITTYMTNNDSVVHGIGNCGMVYTSVQLGFKGLSYSINGSNGSISHGQDWMIGGSYYDIPITIGPELAGGTEYPSIEPGATAVLSFTVQSNAPEGSTMDARMACAIYNSPVYGSGVGEISYDQYYTYTIQTPTPEPTPEPTPVVTDPVPTAPAVEPVTLPEGYSSVKLANPEESVITSFDITSNNNSIVFKGSFDLDNADIRTKLAEIDKYVTMGENFVEVDSVNFPELNVSATIEVKTNINSVEDIRVFKDGVDVTADVTELTYDSANQVLSFNVSGFSRYEVVLEENVLLSTTSDVADDSDTATTQANSQLPLIGALIMLAVIAVGGVALWMKKRKNSVSIQTFVEQAPVTQI